MTRASSFGSTAVGPPDVVRLCRELVARPSENPPGGEEAVASFVAGYLERAGFDVAWHEAAPGRPNVHARLRRGRGRRLILQGHADTKPAVAPGATSLWSRDPFEASEEAGLLYGLGTCDTKGGLAAQLAAACTLARDPSWTGELVVQAVADEEDGSRLGAGHLLGLGLLDADGAVVAEPTGCRPSVGQLGLAWAEVSITGQTAHAGTPERAVDAFRGALRYVAELDTLVAGSGRHPDFPGHPRLNVGAFDLPGHPGTVPGECRLRCDIRVLPGQQRSDVFALYQQAATLVGVDGLAVRVEPYQGGGRPSHHVDLSHPLVRAFLAARSDGAPLVTAPFAGGTDALFFAEAGTPAVVYGPGSLDQAHAPDEFVSVAELHTAYRQLVATSLAFLRKQS